MIVTAGCVAVIAAVLALIWTMQRRFIYFPAGGVPAPSEIGLTDVEPVTFETIDGLSLSGWFFAASGPSPPVTVLVFNGNAGNRSHRRPLAAALQRHGFQVLLVDYRGYGGNPGAPSKNGLAADGRAARAYLAGRSDVDLSRLVYFGESLGTAVAVDLAVEHPPAALVPRSPFTSMADLGRYHYPFLPVRLLLRDRFSAIDQIGPGDRPFSSAAQVMADEKALSPPAPTHPGVAACASDQKGETGGVDATLCVGGQGPQ
jgi:fermentation-respiration switch protein FrsA (DUF1100 family)